MSKNMQRSIAKSLAYAMIASAVTIGIAVVVAPLVFPEKCEPALFDIVGCREIGIILGLVVALFSAAIVFAASRSGWFLKGPPA